MKKDSLDLVFGACSLIGLFLTIALAYTSTASQTSLGASIGAIIALAAVNVFMIVTMLFGYRRQSTIAHENMSLAVQASSLREAAQRSEDNLFETSSWFADVHEVARDRSNELISAIHSKAEISNEEIVELQRTNEMYFLFLIDKVRTLYSELVRHPCAVTLYLVEADSDQNRILTFMRDTRSYNSRKHLDANSNGLRHWQHSAFRAILEGDQGFFASNDLANLKAYVDPNQRWHSMYNSLLATPIRMELAAVSGGDGRVEYAVIGIVIVDSLEGHLDTPLCRNLSRAICALLYNHFTLLNQLLRDT